MPESTVTSSLPGHTPLMLTVFWICTLAKSASISAVSVSVTGKP